MTLSAHHARQLDEIAGRLVGDDPHLARQLSRHRTLRHSLAQFAVAVAVLACPGAGIAVLGLGLHFAILWLIALGAVATIVLPTCAPLLVLALVRRHRRRHSSLRERRRPQAAATSELAVNSRRRRRPRTLFGRRGR